MHFRTATVVLQVACWDQCLLDYEESAGLLARCCGEIKGQYFSGVWCCFFMACDSFPSEFAERKVLKTAGCGELLIL